MPQVGSLCCPVLVRAHTARTLLCPQFDAVKSVLVKQLRHDGTLKTQAKLAVEPVWRSAVESANIGKPFFGCKAGVLNFMPLDILKTEIAIREMDVQGKLGDDHDGDGDGDREPTIDLRTMKKNHSYYVQKLCSMLETDMPELLQRCTTDVKQEMGVGGTADADALAQVEVMVRQAVQEYTQSWVNEAADITFSVWKLLRQTSKLVLVFRKTRQTLHLLLCRQGV